MKTSDCSPRGENPSDVIKLKCTEEYLSSASLVVQNGTNNAPVVCEVAGTRTTLYIQLFRQIHADSMDSAITTARLDINQTLMEHGHDGWLSHSEDPFRLHTQRGVSVMAKSAQSQHLTWGILDSTMKGLQDCLIKNKWYQAAWFQIFDGQWGQVGWGSLMESVAGMESGGNK